MTLTAQTGNWLVVSDLDGTLLDHYSYSHQPVDELLAQLESLKIPLILNSSKTAEEMLSLRESLNNHHPFIVENGSAIYVPPNYFPKTDKATVNEATTTANEYAVITLGATRKKIQDYLRQDAEKFGAPYLSFAISSIEKIVEFTGLSLASARQASQRDYSEPLLWQGSDVEKEQFIARVKAAGLNTLQGGRFLHVLGDCDKGRATAYLRSLYQEQQQKTYQLLAAGDSPNDLAMLAAADIAVIVRSPTQPPPSLPGHPRVFVSQAEGPEGWAEIVSPLLVGK